MTNTTSTNSYGYPANIWAILMTSNFDSLQEAREARETLVAWSKENEPNGRTAKYCIVGHGSNPGQYRLVNNGDIAESL